MKWCKRRPQWAPVDERLDETFARTRWNNTCTFHGIDVSFMCIGLYIKIPDHYQFENDTSFSIYFEVMSTLTFMCAKQTINPTPGDGPRHCAAPALELVAASHCFHLGPRPSAWHYLPLYRVVHCVGARYNRDSCHAHKDNTTDLKPPFHPFRALDPTGADTWR